MSLYLGAKLTKVLINGTGTGTGIGTGTSTGTGTGTVVLVLSTSIIAWLIEHCDPAALSLGNTLIMV